MDHAGDDLQEGWHSNQTSKSITPAIPQSWMPTLSSTEYRWSWPSTGQSPWPSGYPSFIDPSARPGQESIEGILQQQRRPLVLARLRDVSTSPGRQTTQPTANKNVPCGRSRRRSGREDTRHLERKNTKRRKTGPDRFDNYLHGDTPLPPDTTTTDVFTKYPNHITDDDIEELWRLGLSARQISDLMPDDTHFNSEGVHVQQHHSLIQKKFKTFKERHDLHEQAMKGRMAKREGQDLLRPSNSQEYSMQESQDMDSGAGQNAILSPTSTVADLPDLKFRFYPLNPTNDKAFEARMSIELADLEPVAGNGADNDHEICILDLLLRREFQRHRGLLKYQLTQAQRLEFQQASFYNESGRNLSRKWPIPRITTAAPATAPEALRLLQHVIDQIYLHHPATAALPAKRPIFNFQHGDLRTWKVLARTLYYMVSITRRLEMVGSDAEAAGTPVALCENIQRAQGHFGDDRAELGRKTIAASNQGIRPVPGLIPVRDLQPTAFSRGSATTAYRQSPFAAFLETAGAARVSGRQVPTYFGSSISPAAFKVPSISPGNRVGHGGGRGLTAQNSLSLAQVPQAPAPRADSLQPGVSATASNLLSEAAESISFPRDGEEGEDFMDQMIDWNEWDATSIDRAESLKTAD